MKAIEDNPEIPVILIKTNDGYYRTQRQILYEEKSYALRIDTDDKFYFNNWSSYPNYRIRSLGSTNNFKRYNRKSAEEFEKLSTNPGTNFKFIEINRNNEDIEVENSFKKFDSDLPKTSLKYFRQNFQKTGFFDSNIDFINVVDDQTEDKFYIITSKFYLNEK